MLWFKLRADTLQHYEYVHMENIDCDRARSFIKLGQFGSMGSDGLLSRVNNVTVKNCSCECNVFYDVTVEGVAEAQDFTLENINVSCRESRFDRDLIKNTVTRNVRVNGELI